MAINLNEVRAKKLWLALVAAGNVPADIPAQKNDEIAEILTEIYLRLNCKGMVRIDFILLEATGDFYFIEVNTTPGQSDASLIPQQVRAAGMDLGEFYGELVEGVS